MTVVITEQYVLACRSRNAALPTCATHGPGPVIDL
jgi:hypothetical protein